MADTESDADGVTDQDLIGVIAASGVDAAEGQSALSDLYVRHCASLANACAPFIRRMVGNGKLDDIVQDTFIRAAERADAYQPIDVSDPRRISANVHRW